MENNVTANSDNSSLRIADNEIDGDALQSRIEQLSDIREAIASVIVGQSEVVEQMLCALLAGGHGLLEGVPGLAKTLLVQTLADAVALDFRRIQFTPDLMPSDIIGTEILEQDRHSGERSFKFQPGPVFTNILLADEINRTPAKTQAALLEAMQEQAVTFAGERHALSAPFFVLATQNPLEQSGTYALPEAQLDRFLLHIEVDYPDEREEREVLRRTTGESSPGVEPVIAAEEVLELKSLTRQVHISESLLDYVTVLVRSTRPESSGIDDVAEWVRWGAGPRAGQSLVLAAKARALLNGRLAVSTDDIQSMLLPVLRHRLLLNFHAEAERVNVADVVASLLSGVAVPSDPLQ